MTLNTATTANANEAASMSNTKDNDDDLVTYCHVDGRVERLPRNAPAPSWYGSSVILPQSLIGDRENDEIDRNWGMIAEKRGIEAADEWRYYYVRSLLRSKETSATTTQGRATNT